MFRTKRLDHCDAGWTDCKRRVHRVASFGNVAFSKEFTGPHICPFQPLARRMITRLIGLVPSMVVAIAVGRKGIDVLLVASQVALSIVLPFVIFPLVYLASSEAVMRVPKPGGGFKSYKNHWITMSLGYLIFTIVVLANVSHIVPP